MFTEYPKVLNFFQQAIHKPNIELKEIIFNFAQMKQGDEIGAARYLISSYHTYQALIGKLTANAHAQ